MSNSVDFTPLATYSRFFLFFRLIRRIKMIAVRVVLALGLLAVVGGMIWWYIAINKALDDPKTDMSETHTYSQSYSFDSDEHDIDWIFSLIFFAIFGPWLITIVTMSSAWTKFAKVNNFTLLESVSDKARAAVNVPSFRGKLLSTRLVPIEGLYGNLHFILHSRQYKEGGVLRWRERQMDTVLTLLLPADLPHIVINARGNEKARRSNLSKSFPAEHKFQFEGPLGANYDVYAEPTARIVTLQLFTPDVVQVLYDKLPTADIELQGDKLWIVQRYGVLDDRLARTMVEAADALYIELEKQLRVAGLLTANLNTSVQ
jgi:hypothetical protein